MWPVAVTGVRNEAIRVRLNVTNVEGNRLLAAAGARRYAHNWAVAQIRANHEQWKTQETTGVPKAERVRPLSFFTLVKLWDATKAEHTPWFGDHSTWTFRYGIRAAARAHQRFLKGGGRVGFPKFKSRHRDKPRFTVTDGLHLEAGRVRVGKYGWFRVAAPCAAQAKLRRLINRKRARLMNVTVSRHSDGHWYATVCFERTLTAQQTTPPAGPAVGVDVGLKTAAVVATAVGDVVAQLEASRALRDALRHLKHLQRDFSRTETGSANRRKAATRLARRHARVAALRADRLHAFTAALARTHAVVVVEDLAVANMLRNHHLAQAISDQGWGELRRQLGYKTTRHGGVMVTADRFYPSSKTCSVCGAVKSKLSLAERTYRCGTCGVSLDRDVNAAVNLAALGEERQLTLVLVSRVGDRHPGGPSAERAPHACGGDNEPASVLAGVAVEAGTSQPRTRVA